MRQPRQRVPVRDIETGECPFDRLPCQPILNVRIFQDVRRVVEEDEPVVDDWIVEGQCRSEQHRGQNRSKFVLARHSFSCSRGRDYLLPFARDCQSPSPPAPLADYKSANFGASWSVRLAPVLLSFPGQTWLRSCWLLWV